MYKITFFLNNHPNINYHIFNDLPHTGYNQVCTPIQNNRNCKQNLAFYLQIQTNTYFLVKTRHKICSLAYFFAQGTTTKAARSRKKASGNDFTAATAPIKTAKVSFRLKAYHAGSLIFPGSFKVVPDHHKHTSHYLMNSSSRYFGSVHNSSATISSSLSIW